MGCPAPKIEQKILTASRAEDLNSKIKTAIEDDWVPVGSHTVRQVYSICQYRGNQLGGTQHDVEYAQTMRRNG